MTLKRRRRPSLKERLKEKRPEILARRAANHIWETEVRWKNWAQNVQALHDQYAAELLNPMARPPFADSVVNHRARLERMLRQAGMFVDPREGIPAY